MYALYASRTGKHGVIRNLRAVTCNRSAIVHT
jgi:hypothetical protein